MTLRQDRVLSPSLASKADKILSVNKTEVYNVYLKFVTHFCFPNTPFLPAGHSPFPFYSEDLWSSDLWFNKYTSMKTNIRAGSRRT